MELSRHQGQMPLTMLPLMVTDLLRTEKVKVSKVQFVSTIEAMKAVFLVIVHLNRPRTEMNRKRIYEHMSNFAMRLQLLKIPLYRS